MTNRDAAQNPDTRIEPALTEEQWKVFGARKGELWMEDAAGEYVFSEREYVSLGRDGKGPSLNFTHYNPAEYRAAIAVLLDALAQAGEPLLTHEDVEDLVYAGESLAADDPVQLPVHASCLRNLAARIASLLPPEGA